MKKIGIISVATALLFTFTLVTAFAETTTGTNANTRTGSNINTQTGDNPVSSTGKLQHTYLQSSSISSSLSAHKEQQLTIKLQNLKTRAQTEIKRRIASLTELVNHILSIKRLSDSQKSTLTSGIQTEMASLTALLTKINADTDAQALRADVKSIVDSYRVYLLYIPQVQIILAANKLLDAQSTLNSLVAKLQSRIAEVGKSKDITGLTVLLTDMQAKLADAQTKAQGAITTVQGLQPTDYPGNKGSLQAGRTLLQAANQDLKTARQDAEKIVQGLRQPGKTNHVTSGVTSVQTTETPNPTVIPTTEPTATPAL